MTISGAQANQTTGGPQPWNPGGIPDTAADEVKRMNLGVMPDSLARPLSDINRTLVWKYDNSATNPGIASPNRPQRTTNEEALAAATTWGGLYQQLINSLPPDVKAELLTQKEQLYTNRDPSFEGFDQGLQYAARAMSQLADVNKTYPSNSPEAIRQLLNYALPGVALNASLSNSQEVIQNVAKLIDTFGPLGDNFSVSLAQLEGVILGRDQLTAIAQNLIYPQEDSSATIQNLASDPGAFTGATKLSGEGQGLQILAATLYILEVVANAAALQAGSPPLYIALEAATKGATAPPEQGGFIGPELQKLIGGFSSTVDSAYGTRTRPGGEAMLEPLVTAFAALLLGTSGLISDQGIAPLPTEDTTEKKQEQRFSAELTLKLISTSKTFDEIASGVVVTGEIPDSSQKVAANGLTLSAYLLVAYSSGDNRENVLGTIQPELQELFAALSQSELANSPGIGVFLQQGLLALQEGNIPGLAASMDQGLQGAGISPDKLMADLQRLKGIAGGVQQGIAQGQDDVTDTGTSMQAV